MGKFDNEAQLFYQKLLVQYLVARLRTEFLIVNNDTMTNMIYMHSTQ